VNRKDLENLLPALEDFHARFGRYFVRSEAREWAHKYLIGLTMPIERKNIENIAEQVGASTRVLQKFVTTSPWDDDGCIDELQRFVGEEIGTRSGVLVLDDTGFAKKGRCSAGVGRQYSGTLGRTDNCQIGVFLSYASEKGHTLVDRRLYMKEDWFGAGARARRERAGIPKGSVFMTKNELGDEMLRAAHQAGHLPFRWVTGDAAYGDHHDLRDLVEELGKLYCLEVSSDTNVWTSDPHWKVALRRGATGRPATVPRPTRSSPASTTAAEVAAQLAPRDWIRHRVTEGEKGPREYEFARLRVVEKRHGRPGPETWLMLRRAIGAGPDEVKYYVSNAPASMTLADMAWVGCLRWTIEENFELGKGEVGLDHYEVTVYQGWYHHITLSLLALAFLKSTQWRWGKKRRRRNRSGNPVPAWRRPSTPPVDPVRSYRVVRAPATSQGRGARMPSSTMAS
jgi:SRSO17 transposase